MLGETHRYLAGEIGKSLKIEPKFCKLLEEGSVMPDYQETFPHHIGKDNEIERLLRSARMKFLKSDDECYYLLGMAFHYIQDKWTLRARTRDKHTQWEVLINQERVLGDEDLKEKIERATIPSTFKKAYLTFIDILSNEIESSSFWGETIGLWALDPAAWKSVTMCMGAYLNDGLSEYALANVKSVEFNESSYAGAEKFYEEFAKYISQFPED
jgi:hypothetical protein